VDLIWKTPLIFEPAGDTGRFFCRGSGYGVTLSAVESAIILEKSSGPTGRQIGRGRTATARSEVERYRVRLRLQGSNPDAPAAGLEELPTRLNYLMGSDPSRWRRSQPAYARVRYSEVYPHIDLVYYGNQRRLEHDFIVHPGGDPARIRLEIDGAERVEIDAAGDLIMHTPAGTARQYKPVAYQEASGQRQPVEARYVLTEIPGIGAVWPRWNVEFEIGDYDPAVPLIIDPVLVYSGLLGGSGVDVGWSLAVDSLGNTVMVGTTLSTNFPVSNALDPEFNGDPALLPNAPPQDVFISKVDRSGTNLIFSTYLGGTGDDAAYSVVLDSSDNIYLAGQTDSTNFPVTLNAVSTNIYGTNLYGIYPYDAFLTKLDPGGSTLLYSTYLGGTNADIGVGVALDDARDAYVTGFTTSPGFGLIDSETPNFSGSFFHAFLTKVTARDSNVFYTIVWGGSGDDRPQAVAVDASHSAVVVGFTDSFNFPVNNALQTNNGGGTADAFVTKWGPSGTNRVYSTYLGGYYDDGAFNVTVDATGQTFVTGTTASPNFPVSQALFPTNNGLTDVFVSVLNAAGSSFVYSTYFGGSGVDESLGIALKPDGSAYVAGNTTSTNLLVTGRIQNAPLGLTNVLVFGLAPGGTSVVYSVALGGTGNSFGTDVALDADGNALVTGVSGSTAFPLLPSTNGLPNVPGATNVILAKIHPGDLRLSAQTDGAGAVALSWPELFRYYAPQSTNVIPATNAWTAVTNPPTLVGTNLVVTLTNTAGNSFFRLAPRP